jgi:hypothetical protein
MKQPEWPGIATAAALLCAGTIIIAIWRDPSDFSLKDWQTFMAACIALVGGMMAYRGAMAKVNLDRDSADHRSRRERIALFLKVEMALSLLEGEVMRQRKWADIPISKPARKISVSDFEFGHPPELDEAWNNLDLFADETVTTLGNIRSTLRTIDGNNRLWGPGATWEYTWIQMPDEIKRLIVVLTDLESFCRSAVRDMRRETANR